MKGASRRRWVELVDAAANVFYEKGYGASSIQDVADRVQLLKGSIYHYIKTKEDLLFAVAEEAHLSSAQIIEKLRATDLDPATELAAFVRAHLELLIRERVKLTVYLHDFRSLTDQHRDIVAGYRRAYSSYVRDLVARGQESGVFSSSVNPRLATLSILGTVNWTYEWFREDDEDSLEDVIVAFSECALRSVGTDGGRVARILDAGVSV